MPKVHYFVANLKKMEAMIFKLLRTISSKGFGYHSLLPFHLSAMHGFD